MKKWLSLIFILFAGALLMQGFQCSSPEMTTAKIAIQNRDFNKAETYLEKEISKNPNNGEAWLYLAQMKQAKNDLQGAAKAISEADKNIVDEKLKQNSAMFKNQLWVSCYNNGIEKFNQALQSSNNKKMLDEAITNFKIGSQVKPGFSDFYQLLGNTYDAAGDTNLALEYYNKYAEMLQPEINLAKDKRIFLEMGRRDVLSALGTPTSSKGYKFNPKADSIIIDVYKNSDKEIYTYFSETKGDKNFVLTGWRVNPPKDWMQNEKEQPTTFYTPSFFNLAQIYYNKKLYDKVIYALQLILALKPTDSDANNFLVAMYDETGRKEQAADYAKSLVQKDPNNKFYRSNLGDMLLKANNYDGAIEEYKAALKIDPKYEDVYINLGVAYKNKAAMIQKKQIEAKEQKTDEYFPILNDAAESYSKASKLPKFSRNYMIYYDLCEIYYALNNTDKLKYTAKELESMEELLEQKDRQDFYYKLVKVYDKFIKDTAKSTLFQEKANNSGK